MGRAFVSFCAFALLLGASACQKLPDQTPASLPTAEAIPMDYGKLVGITPHGAHPYIAVLWFEKPDKTIVAMRVDLGKRKVIADPLTTIPRR